MIILMGLAGSGKSTQGKILAERLGGVWLSAGQVLRDTQDASVSAVQREGGLVTDKVTIPLMTKEMAQAIVDGKEVILDGFPRTKEQAEWAAENIADRMKVMIQIVVSKKELIRRLEVRGREDDQSREAIEERFRIVEENMLMVERVMGAAGVKTTRVSGEGTPEEVAERIWQVVKKVI